MNAHRSGDMVNEMPDEEKKDAEKKDEEKKEAARLHPETFFLPPLKMLLSFFDKEKRQREDQHKDDQKQEKNVEKLIEKLSEKEKKE